MRGLFYFETCALLVNAGPGLATAEHAAEGAALHVQCIWSLHRDRRIVGAATVRIEDAAAPFLVLARSHVDQDLFAVGIRLGVHGIPAEIIAALLDADLAFLLFGQPDANWRIGIPGALRGFRYCLRRHL